MSEAEVKNVQLNYVNQETNTLTVNIFGVSKLDRQTMKIALVTKREFYMQAERK